MEHPVARDNNAKVKSLQWNRKPLGIQIAGKIQSYLPEIIFSSVAIAAMAIVAEFVVSSHQAGTNETNHTRLTRKPTKPNIKPQNVELLKRYQY